MRARFARSPRLRRGPRSHYCEKARWALDRAGIAYVEEIHAPLLSRLSARGSVPALITDDGTFGDSTDILRWVDHRQPLFRDDAAALEERFDTELGPAARNLSVFHVAPGRKLARRVALWGVPRWERVFGSLFFGALCGGELGAADMSIGARFARSPRLRRGPSAALAAPVILPDSEKSRLPRLDEVSPELRAVVEELRATPAGAFVMRLYAEDRA